MQHRANMSDIKNTEDRSVVKARNRAFRVKADRIPLDMMIDHFLSNNPKMSVSDLLELGMMSFFQRNKHIRKMLEVDVLKFNPNMLCIEEFDFKKMISKGNGSVKTGSD